MSELTDLGIVDAADALVARTISSRELTEACLDRIRACDGRHSHEGDPRSINAWVRVYEDDAIADATRADERLASGAAGPLTGIPIGLKDLYEVAGKPVTASSTLLDDVPERSSAVWERLEAAGMVLLGHLHTHEFAAGGTTDQVGSPWSLDRSAGGSSGGSGAALAARMTPAATGTDTAGSLRIPSACSGTSTIKPSRGLVSLAGIVPLSWSCDHPGPMARTLDDCRALLDGMVPDTRRLRPPATRSLAGTRIALSPRLSQVELDSDVAAGLERALEACRRLGATLIEPPHPAVSEDVSDDFIDVVTTEMLSYHRRFDGRREEYRPALREWVEAGETRAISGERFAAVLWRRLEVTAGWSAWLDEHRVDAIVEPTIPVVAPLRGDGYDHAGSDEFLISLTYLWDWTGFPAVALPAGLGGAGLPVSVSLVGRDGADSEVLALGSALQAELGVPTWPVLPS